MKRLLSYQTWFQFFCYWVVLFFSYQVSAYSPQFYKVSETVGGGTATVLETGKIDTQDGGSGSVQVTLSTETKEPDVESFSITPTDTNMANTGVKQLAVERDKSKSKQAIWLGHLLEQQPTAEILTNVLTGQKLFLPVPQRATKAAQLPSVSALLFGEIQNDAIIASLLKCTNCDGGCATKTETGEFFCAECPGCCDSNAPEKAKKCTQCGCCLGIGIAAKDCCEGNPKCECTTCSKCECKVCPVAGDTKPVCSCCEGGSACCFCEQKLTCNAGAGATITILLDGGKTVKSFQVQLPVSDMNPAGKTITVEYSMSSFKQPNAAEPVEV